MNDCNESIPLGDSPQRVAIPRDVLTSITAARLDDVSLNWGGSVSIEKQITKADSIYILVDTQIYLPTFRFEWVAIVAKKLYVQFPNLRNATIIARRWESLRPDNPLSLGQAGQGNTAPPGERGPSGTDGINGADGTKGNNGKRIPSLYLIAEEVLTFQNTPPPFVYLDVDLRGWEASSGQNGQYGQDGGRGGAGGIGKWNGTCQKNAGRGGPGGKGGNGGAGGPGGDGSNGGSFILAGSAQTLQAMRHLVIAAGGGAGGPPGWPGSNGRAGIGGPGGARPVTCGGGGDGPGGPSNPHVAVGLGYGEDGSSGAIGVQILDVGTLFPLSGAA